MLTGLEPQHHGVRSNADAAEHDPATGVASWLSRVGYATGYLGKYVNATESFGTRVPSAWDEWQVMLGGSGGAYYGFDLNDNGRVRREPDTTYSTDYFAEQVLDFIGNQVGRPFFVVFAPHAPHAPAEPALRHVGRLVDLLPWRPPSWQEEDLSRKPNWVRFLEAIATPEATLARDELRKREIETLLAVDEAVARIIDKLERAGLTDNTLVVYTSDHGIHWGEHWSGTKFSAYEESIRVPYLVRYPARIPRGGERSELVLITDLAPTFAELAGARTPPGLDGRSLAPLLATPGAPWRGEILVESPGEFITAPSHALRTSRWKYIELDASEGIAEELYDLSTDPFELDNLAENPAYAGARGLLAARLAQLRGLIP
jgi:arylsulfatase A-like enzyme